MTSKNPYEIRLDVMKMAKDMLEAEQRAKELVFKEQVNTLRSVKGNDEVVMEFIEKNAPSAYTANDVMTASANLYEFISKTK